MMWRSVSAVHELTFSLASADRIAFPLWLGAVRARENSFAAQTDKGGRRRWRPRRSAQRPGWHLQSWRREQNARRSRFLATRARSALPVAHYLRQCTSREHDSYGVRSVRSVRSVRHGAQRAHQRHALSRAQPKVSSDRPARVFPRGSLRLASPRHSLPAGAS